MKHDGNACQVGDFSADNTVRRRGHADANDPVLLSKVTVPEAPSWAIARPRIERLIAEGALGSLTSVTGPPGAGKTMAIASWAAARTSPGTLAWVALDDYDNEPRVFWSYVVAALREVGITVPRVLPEATRETVDHAFLMRLASVLAAQDPPVVLVLDDFHLLTDPATLDGLDYVRRSAHPGLRLVVASRVGPMLPLHRYRLTGELTEIRADDLAFNIEETGLILAHHGIALSQAAIEGLTGRTEGWVAGIRLAAVSLHGHPDPEQFVRKLVAEDSAITAYLLDEVLNAQPPSVRDMLLRTSILDCINADLATELTGDPQAAHVLPDLARANAFVRPIGHGWYRYHSLLAAVLRFELRSEFPEQLPELHRRAARWYQRNGQLTDAARHAANSGDPQFAAQLDDSLRDNDIDQAMAAFRAALTRMDASPAEAARIRNLANTTDAQIAAEAGAPAASLVVEPLSEREREVLTLLSGMLSTTEIASEMYLSVNTVKTHLRSIYRKLSADRRAEVVRRARQLNLI